MTRTGGLLFSMKRWPAIRLQDLYEKRLARADDEQRLMTTAWYELGTRLERKTLQDRVNQAAEYVNNAKALRSE